jgi:hypothetical protein
MREPAASAAISRRLAARPAALAAVGAAEKTKLQPSHLSRQWSVGLHEGPQDGVDARLVTAAFAAEPRQDSDPHRLTLLA